MEKFIKEIKYERPMFSSFMKKSSFMALYNDTEELKKFIQNHKFIKKYSYPSNYRKNLSSFLQ